MRIGTEILETLSSTMPVSSNVSTNPFFVVVVVVVAVFGPVKATLCVTSFLLVSMLLVSTNVASTKQFWFPDGS